MPKSKKRIAEAASAYILELPHVLPKAIAELLPDESYGGFDGWILVRGPYEEVEDFDLLLGIEGLASDINERYGVDFLVRYRQEEKAASSGKPA